VKSWSDTDSPLPDRVPGEHGPTLWRAVRIVWSAGRVRLIMLVLLMTIIGLLLPVSVWASEHVVNLAVAAEHDHVRPSQWVPWSVTLGIIFAALRLLPTISQNHQRSLSESVSLRVNQLYLSAVSGADQAVVESPAWRDRMTRASHSAGPRAAILVQSLLQFYSGLITSIGVLIVLVTISPLLVLLAVISMVISFPLQHAQANALHKLYDSFTKNERERSYLHFVLSEQMSSKELRAYGLRSHLLDRSLNAGGQWLSAFSSVLTRMNRYSLYVGALTAAVAVASYGYVISLGLHGRITPGEVAAAIGGFMALTSQLTQLTSNVTQAQENITFLDDFFSFMSLKPAIKAIAPETPIPRQGLTIEFENVSFAYQGTSARAISGLNLTIENGELLALVGLNGSGKTTLMKLLLRLYDPDSGTVRFGGVDLRNADPAEIRERIGILFQDFMYYDYTIRDNVSFGRIAKQSDTEDIEIALRDAQAWDLVNRLDNGIEFHLGNIWDGGHQLSGGELQRIALARLFFRNADIWILDEPTASLDAEAEIAIFAQIKRLLNGRIGIITSHRFSTVRLADRIAVMADGSVIELGTHDELVAQGGKYAEMFSLQAQQYR
jgi:ATP-binding cassette, subfamily B, bacterial